MIPGIYITEVTFTFNEKNIDLERTPGCIVILINEVLLKKE